jgi:hypothetical protein
MQIEFMVDGESGFLVKIAAEEFIAYVTVLSKHLSFPVPIANYALQDIDGM